ncbi:MAG: hypothetical protein OEU80_15445 [Deltaproteobacteria bacterium]|jgi:hypothetical protein|nr:hypothetical protein [Deltaproteobacteria bacterium]MDH3852436.1 hypothetical protein [Deltaproteobacteria bacterium]MDH3898164.1 hypothetical protein [Deltaproteobacteria bacterium]MDH3951817.1 hypothetical protein [Deltaproteobacteria bacterium]
MRLKTLSLSEKRGYRDMKFSGDWRLVVSFAGPILSDKSVPGGAIMYIDELVTPDNIDEVKDNLGDFGYVDEIEVGDVISVMECGDGFKIIVWENRYDEGNAVIDFGDDYLWGEWDGARITVEYGDEILAYDIEGDCRFLGVI